MEISSINAGPSFLTAVNVINREFGCRAHLKRDGFHCP